MDGATVAYYLYGSKTTYACNYGAFPYMLPVHYPIPEEEAQPEINECDKYSGKGGHNLSHKTDAGHTPHTVRDHDSKKRMEAPESSNPVSVEEEAILKLLDSHGATLIDIKAILNKHFK